MSNPPDALLMWSGESAAEIHTGNDRALADEAVQS